MTRVKRMIRAGLAGLALVLVVLIAVALVAPRVIDLRPLRDQITGELSQQLGATVTCDALRLSLLPLPAAVLHRVSVSIPGKIDTNITSVSVSPQLLPLLRGKLQLGKVRIESPEITVRRLAPASAGTKSGAGFALAVESALGDVSLAVLSRAAGAAVVVHAGTLTLPVGASGMLQLRGIDAQVRLIPARLSIDLQCTSNIWERLSLRASMDPSSTDLRGEMQLTRLRPQLIATEFMPPGVRLGDSEANLALVLNTGSRLRRLHAAIDGSIPTLTVVRGHDQVVLRSQRLEATFETEGEALRATLAQLRLDSPHLQLSGSLSVASDNATLELHGTDVDVDSVRQAAMLAAGDVPIVRSIFNVLKGGTAPLITVSSRAPSLGELDGDQALRIQGRLVGGSVHVPGVDLDLEKVTGDATVAGGVLVGEQISAQLGRSQATEGRLRVGLSGDTPELHVNTQVRADAAELAAQLKRLITNAAFQNAFERVSDVSGSVSGALWLDGTTSDVAARAEASAFTVSGRVEGVHSPLQIEGGQFVYDTGGIEARDVTLVTGKSRLSEIALRALPGRTGSFEVAAGESQIALDEAYPWLAASGWLPKSPWNPASLSGMLSLTSLHVAGPREPQGDWQLEIDGSAQKLAIESAQLSKRLAIQYPVSLSDLHVRYDGKWGTSFAARVVAPNNLTGAVDLVWSGERLEMKHLSVRDSQSDASLALALTPHDLSLTFKGSLTKATLDRLIENELLAGSMRGDISVRLRLDQPARAFVTGRLEAQDAHVPLPHGRSLTIEDLALDGTGHSLSGNAVIDMTEGTRLQVQGHVQLASQVIIADLDVAAGRVDWSAIVPWISPADGAAEPSAAGSWAQSLRGKMHVTAESFSYGGFTWKPVRAVVAFAPNGLTVMVKNATICGVTTPGTITAGPQGLTLAFKPAAQNQELQTLQSCMGGKDKLATGRYTLSADVTAGGTAAEISRSLQGPAQFHATNGRLYGMGFTARALSILSAATGAVWAIPDITKEGLPYDDINLKGDLKGATLVLREATLNGPVVRWAAEGTVDFSARRLDLTLLVAPLASVDTVVSRIPILGGVLGGSLVSVPVKVSGDFANPSVTPLSPSAVGKSLLNVMTRTLKLPLKLIEPAAPQGAKP
jgi:cytoskeletal protein CcmA (bactofilin family)